MTYSGASPDITNVATNLFAIYQLLIRPLNPIWELYMYTQQNQEFVLQLYREATSAKQLRDRFNPGYKSFSHQPDSSKSSEVGAFNRFFVELNKAFLEYQLTINSLVVKDNYVSVCYTIRGTQKGYFKGRPPAGEKITISRVDLFRLENERVIEYRNIVQQLSALPPQSDEITVSCYRNHASRIVYTFDRRNKAWKSR
jgi:predicted ester cyclase